FIKATGLKIDATPGESFLRAIKGSQADAPHAAAEPAVKPAAKPATKDPIAALIGPSKRVLAVQHALADFGYGQIKPTGVNDRQTRAAIEKFERERHLSVDGKISGRFLHELAAMTGRSLEQ
ncbi:MAG: peptidoglycan-binding protein, partial [Pseudolabrys sp.]